MYKYSKDLEELNLLKYYEILCMKKRNNLNNN